MSKSTDDIDVLIEAGDSFFKTSNYDKAIKAYTEAIDGKSANTNSRAYSNRSAVYSKQNKHSLAYEDALKAIDLGEHLNESTLFRAGKSAYAMRQYQTAFAHFDACSKANPQNEEATRELTRTTQRLIESSTGQYDLASLTKEMFCRVAKRAKRSILIVPILSRVKSQ
jgi:tetratricopeptide (TPR) repeat protein